MSVDDREAITCPCCSSGTSTVWALENGYTAVKCADCGLVYVNPRPREEVITEANKVGVHQGEDGALDVTARRVAAKVPYYSAILCEMFERERVENKPLRWLDVGAGYGEFVEAVISTMPAGTVAEGLEPMAPKVEVAKSLGIPVDSRDLKDVGTGYDVISLINVYSHIPDFDGFGRMLVEKLNSGGVLFMETGNVAALSREQFPDLLYLPDHMVFSSLPQMRIIVDKLDLDLELHKELPIDNIIWCLKSFVKGLKRGKIDIHLPGQSAFRTVFYKARRRD